MNKDIRSFPTLMESGNEVEMVPERRHFHHLKAVYLFRVYNSARWEFFKLRSNANSSWQRRGVAGTNPKTR